VYISRRNPIKTVEYTAQCFFTHTYTFVSDTDADSFRQASGIYADLR
jgi:hypothetical protein